jgi:hypothetical protein
VWSKNFCTLSANYSIKHQQAKSKQITAFPDWTRAGPVRDEQLWLKVSNK